MFTVLQVGSRQFRASEGDTIDVDRLENKVGDSVSLANVLLFSDGKEVRVGQPFLKDVKVTAQVVKHLSDRKVVAFKFKKRKDWSKKVGHRKRITKLRITKISA